MHRYLYWMNEQEKEKAKREVARIQQWNQHAAQVFQHVVSLWGITPEQFAEEAEEWHRDLPSGVELWRPLYLNQLQTLTVSVSYLLALTDFVERYPKRSESNRLQADIRQLATQLYHLSPSAYQRYEQRKR